MIGSNLEPFVDVSSRRPNRVSHESDRYYYFLVRDRDPVELDENNKDPITYMDAMQKSDSEK